MYQSTLHITSQIYSQHFLREAFRSEKGLRGEALKCVIGQDGLRIKYLVPAPRCSFWPRRWRDVAAS